ncbi:MAG: hypothetical protein COA69_09625 [Robiginitomaculum sp.]|nr:MAG: hypothetical protein COA69_09625 [Robiginitomaculum sp.]
MSIETHIAHSFTTDIVLTITDGSAELTLPPFIFRWPAELTLEQSRRLLMILRFHYITYQGFTLDDLMNLYGAEVVS